MDAWLFHLINDSLRSPLLDAVMPVFSDKNYVVIPGALAAVLICYFGGRYARTVVLAVVLAVAAADLGSERVLKPLFQQERPYAREDSVHLHRNGQWIAYQSEWYALDSRKSHGMPSSHAANAAAAAVVLFLARRRTAWVCVPIALLVGLSRVYTGNHYPAQVLAGFVWGGAMGYVAYRGAFWLAARIWGPPGARETDGPSYAPDRKAFHWILAIWVASTFAFLYLGVFDLAGDEAQYWDWSRRLDLCYYSKPPMVAYVIDIFASAGGNNETAIRSAAMLLSAGALALVYALTLRIARSERAALVAAVAALAMPATWAGSALITIDPILVFFWLLAMYAFHRAVAGDRGMWALTGAALGLGMLAKFTMAVLLLSFALYLLLVDRRSLRTRGPWLALLIAFALQSGVIYWNAQHDWVSFRHTAAIGLDEGGWSLGGSLAQVAEFLGAQAGGVVSPILFGLFAWAVWQCARKARADRDAAYLLLCFGVLFAFYLVVSFTRPPQANWPVAAYPAAAVALGWAWVQRPRGRGMTRLLAAGIALGCLLGAAARSTDVVYLLGAEPSLDERDDRLHLLGMEIDPDVDPTNKLRGGRELGAALEALGYDPDEGPFLFSDRYQLTAWLAFYAPGRPRAYCIPIQRRMNQYDLWGGWDELVGRDGLFVTGGDAERAQMWLEFLVQNGVFEEGMCLGTYDVKRGHTVVKTFTISRLSGYTGLELVPEGRY